MKAPICYFGGKTGLASRLAEMMPPHRVYIEPFFGSGAVLFAKRPAVHEIVNDLDGAVVAFFRCLRERPDDLARVCALSPHARDEFDAADPDAPGLDDLEVARRWWVRVNQSFAKSAGRKSGWSVTTARTQSVPASMLGRIDRFAACADRLARVTIENCDAVDLVDRLATADSVIYADPPYLAESRVMRHGNAGDYRVDMGTPEAHRRLAEALHATDATVMLSGYHSPLYDELYGDWHVTEWKVHSHSLNAVTHTRSDRVEVLWSNRDLGGAPSLFDAEFEAVTV